MRIALTIVFAFAATLGLSSSALPSTARDDREPAPLRGAPLQGETGLRLVVADNPPFVLDVDTGRVTPVPAVRPLSALDHKRRIVKQTVSSYSISSSCKGLAALGA